MSSKEWAMLIACAVTCGFCGGSGIGFTCSFSVVSSSVDFSFSDWSSVLKI